MASHSITSSARTSMFRDSAILSSRAVRPLTARECRSARHPAAVHHQVLAGDETRLVRRQEEGGIGDILRSAEPRQRRAAVAVVDPARLYRAAALAGEDFARRHRVADDVVLAVVGGDL